MRSLAARFGRSPSQIYRAFRREVGRTPYDYFLERKLDLARKLIRYTDSPVKAVAEELGFSDEYHFSNFFRKRAGMSPTRYRDQDAPPPDRG